MEWLNRLLYSIGFGKSNRLASEANELDYELSEDKRRKRKNVRDYNKNIGSNTFEMRRNIIEKRIQLLEKFKRVLDGKLKELTPPRSIDRFWIHDFKQLYEGPAEQIQRQVQNSFRESANFLSRINLDENAPHFQVVMSGLRQIINSVQRSLRSVPQLAVLFDESEIKYDASGRVLNPEHIQKRVAKKITLLDGFITLLRTEQSFLAQTVRIPQHDEKIVHRSVRR